MSKCLICGNELVTGDIHWQSGMCNKCWDEHYAVKGGVPLDKFYSELYIDLLKDYRKLEQQLADKDGKINKLSEEHFEMFGDMKDYKNLWLAEQRKNKEICKQVCNKVLELCDEKFRSINEFDFVEVISRDELIEVLDYIEGGE